MEEIVETTPAVEEVVSPVSPNCAEAGPIQQEPSSLPTELASTITNIVNSSAVEEVDENTTIGEDEAVTFEAPSPIETVPIPSKQQPVSDAHSNMGSQWIGGCRRSARLQPQMGTVFVKGLRRSARLAAVPVNC